RAGDFMHEVTVAIKERGAVSIVCDQMSVPDLVVKRAAHDGVPYILKVAGINGCSSAWPRRASRIAGPAGRPCRGRETPQTGWYRAQSTAAPRWRWQAGPRSAPTC